MDFFKMLAQLTAVPPVLTFFYDLIDQFVGHNRFLIRPTMQWLAPLSPGTLSSMKHFIASISSQGVVDKTFATPFPLVLLVLPVFFFLIYRILFIVQGGKAGGYKSRH